MFVEEAEEEDYTLVSSIQLVAPVTSPIADVDADADADGNVACYSGTGADVIHIATCNMSSEMDKDRPWARTNPAKLLKVRLIYCRCGFVRCSYNGVSRTQCGISLSQTSRFSNTATSGSGELSRVNSSNANGARCARRSRTLLSTSWKCYGNLFAMAVNPPWQSKYGWYKISYGKSC